MARSVSTMLTTQEAAERLRLNVKTVRREIGRHNLRATLVGRRWLIEEADLDRYFAAGQNTRR